MAHQSSAESDDQIPSKSLDLNSPHPGKDIINMEQQQQKKQDPGFSLSKVNRDGIDRDKSVTKQDPSGSKPLLCNEEKMALQEAAMMDGVAKESSVAEALEEDSGRERLKRHRVEVAGRVWIPDMWGQEELLKDWIDCSAFDAPLVPSRISTAREALVEECTRANAAGLRIENSFSTCVFLSRKKQVISSSNFTVVSRSVPANLDPKMSKPKPPMLKKVTYVM